MVDKDLFEICHQLQSRYKILLISIFCSLTIFTYSLILDASAQDVTDVKPGNSLNDVPCEPMLSNVTVPVPSEDVLPPEMYMVYKDGLYEGELSQSKYREGETFSDLDILPENISADLPTESIEVENGTCVQYIVRGTPSSNLHLVYLS